MLYLPVNTHSYNAGTATAYGTTVQYLTHKADAGLGYLRKPVTLSSMNEPPPPECQFM